MDMSMHDHPHPTGVHNMALVGDHHIFLSHLPMFMPPHDAQVVLEATFTMKGKNVDDVYFADRASNKGIRFYTIQPEVFAIQELFQPEPEKPLRTTFKATVFRGHLEKGGTPIEALRNVDVHVTRLVLGQMFSRGDKATTLTYTLFGSPQELFLAHLISQAPDFDQILSISATGSLPSADEMLRGVTVEIVNRPSLPATRLKNKEVTAARAHVTGAHQFLDLNVTVQAELYFEEGELSSSKMSNTLFDQTQEEQKAGFD